MYFWKYWRDTRRGVFVYVILFTLFMAVWFHLMVRANRTHEVGGDATGFWQISIGMIFGLNYLCGLVMGFCIGCSSAGADIGSGSGDFLFTRPRSRKFFVWAGWSAGMLELLGLLIFTALLIILGSSLVAGPIWRQPREAFQFFVTAQFADLPLFGVSIILTTAIIFGLTYFFSILFRSSQRGVVWSLAIFFGYSIVGSLLKFYAGISLPSLTFTNFSFQTGLPWYQAPEIHAAGWALVALACPLAAQLVLDRVDV
jgi:hypothetical protein